MIIKHVYRRRISRALLFCLVCASPLLSLHPAMGGGMTPRQLAELEQIGSAVITPDERYIAFIRVVPRNPFVENAPSQTNLHVMDRRTGESQKVDIEGHVGNLQVRPQNDTFTFTARIQDDQAISLYEFHPGTGETRKLYEYIDNISAYSWHPSGNRFSFIASEQLNLPESPLPYEPTAYEEYQPNRFAFIVDLQNEEPDPLRLELDGSVYLMAWNPSGEVLAVSETPTPHVDDFYMFQRVKIVDGESGRVVNTINNEGKLAQIIWSPDGNRLALRAGDHIHDPIDGRIMVVRAGGGTPENIYPEFEGKFEHIAWPEDEEIRFIASESTARSYGAIRPDGSGFERKPGMTGLIPAGFMMTADGTVLFTAHAPDFPSELFLLEPDAQTPERLTVSNEWLEEIAMGRQEVVTYQARDGRRIEGLLIYPMEETGEPYPTIVMVHGGPEAHYSNGWLTAYSMPGQVGAARGFAVFYPNYRGSTGRGLEFLKSSQGDLAGAEFDDIVDGVDYLIEQGITDGDRVGVTGGSYGGYATAWMSTRYSHRFAAGVMFVGISNNISKWGTSDIPEELYLVHSRKRIWDHWQWNLERSPVYHVDNSRTALLIMHGENDTRVHPSQSLELYRHIKVRKPEVPVRLIWYPDEGHGNVNATSRFDYNLRMLQWFETFLSSEPDPQLPEFHLDFEELGVNVPDNG